MSVAHAPVSRRRAGKRVGTLFLLLAIVLTVVMVIGFQTIDREPQRAPILTGDETQVDGLEATGSRLFIYDPVTGQAQWQIEYAKASMSDPSALREQGGAMEFIRPVLNLFDQSDPDRVTASLSADAASVDMQTKRATLRGVIRAVLNRTGGESIEVSTQGPLIVALDQQGDMAGATAMGDGEVSVRSGTRVDVLAVGLDVDMATSTLTLRRDVRVIASLDQGGGLPGCGSGTLSLSCRGAATFVQNGGPDGIAPTFAFDDEVVVLGDDGARLDCGHFELSSAPGKKFIPELLVASKQARLRIPAAGGVEGSSLVAKREADGSWHTEVLPEDGGRMKGWLALKSAAGIERRLELSAAESLVYERDAMGIGRLTFRRDVQGTLGEDSRFSASESLAVTLAGATAGSARPMGGISELVALGQVELIDGGVGGLGLGGEEPTYDSITARASRAMTVHLDAERQLRELELEGQASFEARGVDASSWQGAERAGLLARADMLSLVVQDDGSRRFESKSRTTLEERDAAGNLSRFLDCQDFALHIPCDSLELPRAEATGSAAAPLQFRDTTFKPELKAKGESAVFDGSNLVITGKPALAHAGEDSIESASLGFDLVAKAVRALPGQQLTIKIAQGKPGAEKAPIVATGQSVTREEAKKVWILAGGPGRPATAGSLESTQSYHLETELLEIDPATQAASCPRGGHIQILRAADGGTQKVERTLIDCAGPLVYAPAKKLVTASTAVHMRAERENSPFEFWSDQATVSLQSKGKDSASLELARVTATGNLRLNSGPYRATGNELQWDALKGEALLNPASGKVLEMLDTGNNIRYQAIELTFKEGQGGSKAFRNKGLQIMRGSGTSGTRPK